MNVPSLRTIGRQAQVLAVAFAATYLLWAVLQATAQSEQLAAAKLLLLGFVSNMFVLYLGASELLEIAEERFGFGESPEKGILDESEGVEGADR